MFGRGGRFYTRNDRQLHLAQFPLPAPMAAPDVAHEVIQIRGNTGYLISLPDVQNVNLIWSEAGLAILLDCECAVEELLAVAEGLSSYSTE